MDSRARNDGMGFLGWLGLLLIALKLTGYIDMPWVWVLAPIWGPFAFIFAVFVFGMTVALIGAVATLIIEALEERKR